LEFKPFQGLKAIILSTVRTNITVKNAQLSSIGNGKLKGLTLNFTNSGSIATFVKTIGPIEWVA
jgi:hypothetical protein